MEPLGVNTPGSAADGRDPLGLPVNHDEPTMFAVEAEVHDSLHLVETRVTRDHPSTLSAVAFANVFLGNASKRLPIRVSRVDLLATRQIA
jgi:hypothetical protein